MQIRLIDFTNATLPAMGLPDGDAHFALHGHEHEGPDKGALKGLQ